MTEPATPGKEGDWKPAGKISLAPQSLVVSPIWSPLQKGEALAPGFRPVSAMVGKFGIGTVDVEGLVGAGGSFPASSMLVVHNDDRPGMIGIVGTALGRADISISSMAVGPDPETKTALMVLSTEAPTPSEVLDELRGTDGIQDIHLIALR